jgi:Fe-S-cluster-containing hydrogenase component 2
MASLSEHPTVKRFYQLEPIRERQPDNPSTLDPEWLRQLCLAAGADDAGFVDIDRTELADQRDSILAFFPRTKALISIICRMNREPVRSTERSVSNLEFHHAGDRANDAAHRIVAALEERGIRAVNPSVGFPMEMDRFPGRVWVVSHKPVAVAAGLGHMGIHRNVIHPKFGNYILLATVLVDAEITSYTSPIDYNPCLECKLCVAACPVGAIGSDGYFNFSACYTHNYREFMGGFNDWVETIAESGDRHDYRRHVTGAETASMWQSLSFGANYKSAYCMAVCPAGEDVIAPFLTDRKAYLEDVVRPLQQKHEAVYVTPGSDAEDYVARRFPHKTAKRVANGLRPPSIKGFLNGLRLVFQPDKSKGLDVIYHFTFTGAEQAQATVAIRNQTLEVTDGHAGQPKIRVTADSRTWLGFLAKERSLLRALLTRKIRIKGSPRWLLAFARCFPS